MKKEIKDDKRRREFLSILLVVYVLSSIAFFSYMMTWKLTEEFENPPPYFSEERYRISLEEVITDILTTIGAVIVFSLIVYSSCCLAFYIYDKFEERRMRKEANKG